MAAHWLLHDTLAWLRAIRLRRATRDGYSVSDSPAFDPATDAWFRARLATTRGYVEYGSGASTILAGRAGIPTVSMESDPRYAAAVRAAIPPGAQVTILDAGLGMTEEWGYPVRTRRSAARLERWAHYAGGPLEEAGRQGWTPDLVLVDGRFRRACALSAARAIRSKGGVAELLFDDYAGRPGYRAVERFLGAPRMIGRAALFPIGPGEAGAEIDDAAVAEAVADFR